MQPNWKKMFLLSFLIHLGVFSLVLFVPETAPTRSLKGVIYEVNLVELPKTRAPGKNTGKAKTSAKAKKGVLVRKRRPEVKRIGKIRAKEKPVVIAKKVVKRKKKQGKKTQTSPDKVLKEALAKVEKKLETQEKKEKEERHIEEAISRIKEGVKEEAGALGSGPVTGLRIQIYKAEVESRIKGNWAYPAGLASPTKRQELEAIVILTVLRDGTISKFDFKKRSGDPIFDESVARAIERSNPLPPFPEGFLKNSEEIEINFNLRELETA